MQVPPETPQRLAGLTAAAYTNNDLETTTGTSLYDIDITLNQVALQSPANNGTLASTGMLGVDADADAASTSSANCATARPPACRASRPSRSAVPTGYNHQHHHW